MQTSDCHASQSMSGCFPTVKVVPYERGRRGLSNGVSFVVGRSVVGLGEQPGAKHLINLGWRGSDHADLALES